MTDHAPLLQKVATDPVYQRAYLAEMGRQDLTFFSRHILGYTDMNAEHEALCEFLQHDPATIKLMLMPRYTFKSSIITIGHSLWLLANDPNERLLLYSDATEKAEGFLTGIKAHLTGSIPGSLFRAVYGPWEVDPKRGVWNQGAITVAPRTHAHVEPSVDTAGMETSKVGKHYSRLKFDDLVSDKNITTRELMDKAESVYKNAGSLLQPSGKTDLAGTRWHFGDLYGRLLVELKGDPRFALFHRKAFTGTTYFFADIGKDSLTPEFLTQKRKAQGSYLFSALYQNEPVDDETATFKVSDFTFYDPAQRPQGLYITCVLDPIPPHEGTKGDDAALTVVGTDHELNLYVLDIVAGRLQPSEQIDELFRLHQKWHLNAFGVETNAFQKVMRRDIEFRYQQERATNPTFRFFHIEEFVGSSLPNKEHRIRGLQPYHERGALRFPGTTVESLTGHYRTLAYQMLEFPRSAKDDLCFVSGTKVATLCGEKAIEDIQVGERVLTPTGVQRVLAARSTGYRSVISRNGLTGTPNHPIFQYGKGLTALDTLPYTDSGASSHLHYTEVLAWKYQRLLNSMASSTTSWEGRDAIISAMPQIRKIGSILKDCMWRCGSFIITGQCRQAMKFIIQMGTLLTTHQTIWSVYRSTCIAQCLSGWIGSGIVNTWNIFVHSRRRGMLQQLVANGIDRILSRLGENVSGSYAFASNVGLPFRPGLLMRNSVRNVARNGEDNKRGDIGNGKCVVNVVDDFSAENIEDSSAVADNVLVRFAEVFNLTVEHDGLYYANGILVSNCDSLAGHIPLHQRGDQRAIPQTLPYLSAAWLEREQQQETYRVMARRPRWTRHPVPELSFS